MLSCFRIKLIIAHKGFFDGIKLQLVEEKKVVSFFYDCKEQCKLAISNRIVIVTSSRILDKFDANHLFSRFCSYIC